MSDFTKLVARLREIEEAEDKQRSLARSAQQSKSAKLSEKKSSRTRKTIIESTKEVDEACSYSNPAMEGHTYTCKDCGCEMHNCDPDCNCPHDSHDEQGNWWVDENGNGVPDFMESKITEEHEYINTMFAKMQQMCEVMEKSVTPDSSFINRINETGGDSSWINDVRSRLNALYASIDDARMGALGDLQEGKYKVGYKKKYKK